MSWTSKITLTLKAGNISRANDEDPTKIKGSNPFVWFISRPIGRDTNGNIKLKMMATQ